MFEKLSLELGGKNPNIVFADANFEEALEMAVKALLETKDKFMWLDFVEESIFQKFKTAFVEKTKQLKVGDPKEITT